MGPKPGVLSDLWSWARAGDWAALPRFSLKGVGAGRATSGPSFPPLPQPRSLQEVSYMIVSWSWTSSAWMELGLVVLAFCSGVGIGRRLLAFGEGGREAV